jgi:hypothetical protein
MSTVCYVQDKESRYVLLDFIGIFFGQVVFAKGDKA